MNTDGSPALLACLADALFLVNTLGEILEANDAACESLQWPPGSLRGANMADIAFAPDGNGHGPTAWWQSPHAERPLRLQLSHRRRDGSAFPVDVHVRAAQYDGQACAMAVVRDISAFAAMEQELRSKQALLRATLQADDDGVMVMDAQGCVLLANEQLAAMWRLPQKLLQADGDACVEQFKDELEEPGLMDALLQDNASRRVSQDLMRFKDGRIFERYGHPIVEDGRVLGRIWSFRDVTEKKWAEFALRESEVRYRTLFDQALDMIVVADAETGEILDCNKAAETFTGRSCEELLGRHQSILHPPVESRPGGPSATFSQHLDTMEGLTLESQVQHVSGQVRDVNIVARAMQLNGRRVLQWVFHDVTGYKRVQRELAQARDQLEERVRERTVQLSESEAKFRALVETSSDWIWELDAEGRYIFASPKVQDILGYTPEELQGRSLSDLLAEPPSLDGLESVQAEPREIERCLAERRAYTNLEYVVRHKDGAAVVLESSGLPVLDAGGALAGFRGVDRDITARRRAEAQLLQAKNRAEAFSNAKSRFLSRVTHELKTPINAVLGMADLLLEEELPQQGREYLEHIQHSARQLLGIVQDILDYSRLEQTPESVETETMETEAFFQTICHKHEPGAGRKGLQLELQLDAGIPAALTGAWGHLQRILDHLLDNAVKFTTDGSVRVEADAASPQACDYMAAQAAPRCDTALHIRVQDTGPGIPEDLQEQIFESFFQVDGDLTRSQGGAGMGLAVCSHFVQLLGGRLWVESRPGSGSIFHLLAPFVTPRNS